MKQFNRISTVFLIAIVTLAGTSLSFAQDVDDIIDNYFENTGGKEAWGALKGMKVMAKMNQGGMSIPIEIVQLSDGKRYSKVSLQGNSFMQGVFDGTTLWSFNFQTQTNELADEETTQIMKLNANDFPDSFFNYKEKGYQAELIGTDTINGAETYKIKLTKEPITIGGEQFDDITYYYFDTENFIPVAQESEIPAGPGKGMIQQITFSDYNEVDGLYFAFSMTQGVKGGMSAPITVESVELNPEIDDSIFDFPETDEEGNK